MSTPSSPSDTALPKSARTAQRVKTPTVIQMEAVECGAAALGIVLGYYGHHVPLEELRTACGVSRNGVNALNIVRAARQYGLTAKGKQAPEPEDLKQYRLPIIVYWNFNHFLVVEGFGKGIVYLNDPASGPRTVSSEEFNQSFTGVVLIFEPGPDFKKQDNRRSLLQTVGDRLVGARRDVLYVFLVSLALMITGLVIPTFSRIFVDNVLVSGQDIIQPLLIGMILTAVLRGIFTWMQQHSLLRLETRLAITSSGKFLWHVLQLPSEFFTQRFAGDISSRVMINDRVARLLSGDLATAMLNLVVIVFYVLVMFRYDVLLTLVGIAIAAVNLLVFRFVARRRVDANKKLQQEQGKLQGVMLNGLQIIETLKASGSESNFFVQYAGFQAKSLEAEQQMGVVTSTLQVVPTFLTALNTAIILIVGGLRVMDGFMTVGMLVAFQSLMASFIAPVNQLVGLAGSFQEVEAETERLDDVLRYAVDPQLTPQEIPEEEAQQAKLTSYLDLKDVSFGYSKLEPALIEKFDLSLKPGEWIALVGMSGSGKSTVAKVVSGLYPPWSGEILFDGKPRDQIPRVVMTNSVAMVDQDIFLFEGTIRDNLTMWDSTIPDNDIIQAAKDACIHAEIASRPGGYEALVQEGGRNFSGGQRQRLEIARALVSNPSILILDEATSALDPIVEKTIFNNLRRRGCTCLIIAHRLSTIRDCDEIIVLENGKIVERGTHNRLFAMKRTYSRLISSESYETEKTVMQSILEKL